MEQDDGEGDVGDVLPPSQVLVPRSSSSLTCSKNMSPAGLVGQKRGLLNGSCNGQGDGLPEKRDDDDDDVEDKDRVE